MPSDLVGTRIYRPDTGRFDTELGPVFGNFLLADEINRAPAKVQSALLEVMQERQVTIAGETFPLPRPFLVLATQNPIESEGTYPLPEAQVDRFLFKLIVDYPSRGRGGGRRRPRDRRRAEVRERVPIGRWSATTRSRGDVFVDRDVIGYAVALADATRHPGKYGLHELEGLIEYGSSPRGPIGTVQAAQALALLRGRNHVVAEDVADLAADVLRHRLVLTYDALGDGVVADDLLERILDTVGGVPRHGADRGMSLVADPPRFRLRGCPELLANPPGRQGPGPMQGELVEALDLVLARRASGALPGERRAAGRGTGTELAQIRPYQFGDDVRRIDAAASARTGLPHVRDHVPERTLTTWLLVDVSASMAFGTADRLKSDVAEGVALVIGRLAVRRAGRVALLTCGAPSPQQLPPRGGRPQLVALRRALAAGVAPDGFRPEDDALAAGLRRIGRLTRGPGLVVVISDFREESAGGQAGVRRTRKGTAGDAAGADDVAGPPADGGPVARRPQWARALAALSARHDVLAVEVVDPREGELPDAGHLVLVDPETGARIEADSSSAELRRRFAAAELARRDELKSHLRRARARHVEVATDGDWLRALGRSLR